MKEKGGITMKKTVLKLFLLLAALGLLLWACGAAGVWTGEDLSLRLDLSLAAFLKLGSEAGFHGRGRYPAGDGAEAALRAF